MMYVLCAFTGGLISGISKICLADVINKGAGAKGESAAWEAILHIVFTGGTWAVSYICMYALATHLAQQMCLWQYTVNLMGG